MTTELQGERGWYTLRGTPVEGGQAQVWRASAPDGSEVAVKRALPGARFMRAVADEARSMRELAQRVPDAHRWFVPVLDEGADAHGLPFYVMPLFEATLADVLVAAAPLVERLDLLVQAALALELLHRSAAHGRVLVHRDVKPHNFLVRRGDGRLRVALSDFGIARDEDMLLRQTRTVMLSMSYAPPEQYLPLRAEPDASVDVFALAAMVYEGLTLGPPPRVAARATEWHGPDADVLLRLYTNRARLGADDLARLEQLRARPVRSLLRVDAGPPLLAEEVAGLRSALRAASDLPTGDALSELLAPVLARSLEPDPMHRLGSASSLRKACQEAWERLAGAEWAAPGLWGEVAAAGLSLPSAGAAATAAWDDDPGSGATMTPVTAPPPPAVAEAGPTVVPTTGSPSRRGVEAEGGTTSPAPAAGARSPGGLAVATAVVLLVGTGWWLGGWMAPAPVVAEAPAAASTPPVEAPATEGATAVVEATPAAAPVLGRAPTVEAAPEVVAAPAAAPAQRVTASPPVPREDAPTAAASRAAPPPPAPAEAQAVSAPPEPQPAPPDAAPAQVIVSVSIEGYSMMAHGWDGGGATERGSSLRTLRPGSHSLELYHAGEVQRRVPVVVRERDGELVAEVGDGGARVTCRASQGRIGVVVNVTAGPRCRP